MTVLEQPLVKYTADELQLIYDLVTAPGVVFSVEKCKAADGVYKKTAEFLGPPRGKKNE